MENFRPITKLYSCKCQKLLINSQQLSRHLRLPKIHKIIMVDQEISSDDSELRNDEICNHIKSLRLSSDIENNRLTLFLAIKIFTHNINLANSYATYLHCGN